MSIINLEESKRNQFCGLKDYPYTWAKEFDRDKFVVRGGAALAPQEAHSNLSPMCVYRRILFWFKNFETEGFLISFVGAKCRTHQNVHRSQFFSHHLSEYPLQRIPWCLLPINTFIFSSTSSADFSCASPTLRITLPINSNSRVDCQHR